MGKPTICIGENKVTAQLISAFVFATLIVQILCFLNPKFPASNQLLWLYSLVCVGCCRKPKLLVFSHTGSILFFSAAVAQDMLSEVESYSDTFEGMYKYVLVVFILSINLQVPQS